MFEYKYNPNISFINNEFLSIHNKSFLENKNEESEILQLENKTSFYKFYFKRDTKFKIPKVFISLHLFHPYLRPMNPIGIEQDCFYFKIIEMFAAIKRKINDKLSDALRAGNEIEFGQNENYLFINIFCYEDIAYKIMVKIRKILFHTDWELTDFKSNNEIYKNEAFQDFFFYSNILDIPRSLFNLILKNSLYNKYLFLPKQFDYQNCIKNSFDKDEFNYLNTFIINAYIYGDYTKEQAQNISDLFEVDFSIDNFIMSLDNIHNHEIKDNSPDNFVNWVNEIHKLKNNYVLTVKNILNENIRISYIKFNESILSVSLLDNILQNILKVEHLWSINMLIYKDIYFEFIFYDEENDKIFKDEFLMNSWDSILSKATDYYNTNVDNIVNKYYYLKKNFRLNLLNQQKSLIQKAEDVFHEYLYEGTIISSKQLFKMYDDKYKNKRFDKKELNNLINCFSNILERNRLDIFLINDR